MPPLHARGPLRALCLVAAVLALLTSCRPKAVNVGAPGDAERRAVLATVDRLFQAMATRDSSLFRSVFAPGATLVGVRSRANGEQYVQSISWDRFAAMNQADRRGQWIERAWDPEVRIRGTLATVWAMYDFHFGATPSHCGVDSVQLLKIGGEWKIVAIADTYERNDCPTRRPPESVE